MDVHVDQTGTPRLEQAGDFTSLRLTGTRPSSPEAREALARHGVVLGEDGGHGYIDPAAFVRLAGAAADASGWHDGFDRMVEHATSKGWTDEAGRIRAHAEWMG